MKKCILILMMLGGTAIAQPPPGYVDNALDCDDNNAAINPEAVEICDGIDNNCDGQIDEGCDFPIVTLTAPDKVATEFPYNAGRFKVTRTGSTATKLKVFYVVGGTATTNDYAAFKGFVMIPIGQPSANWLAKPTIDSITEPVETVIITLTNGPGYSVGFPNQATVKISDR